MNDETVKIFERDTHLLERDSDAEKLNRFLDGLSDKKRGVFVISGESGSGQSRFLSLAIKTIILHKFFVVKIPGKEKLGQQPFEAFKLAFKDLKKPPIDYSSTDQFCRSFDTYCHRNGIETVIICVDDLQYLDSASRECLTRIQSKSNIPVLGIIYTTDYESSPVEFSIPSPIHNTIELTPLSREGVRIWLRSLLKWEPPSTLIQWLYHGTSGLPGYVQNALIYLMNQGILSQLEEGNWQLSPDFQKIKLRDCIGIRKKIPINNLPAQLNEFIERQVESQQISKLLDHYRLITITGSIGSGKTRLAIAVAEQRKLEYRHGIFYFNLKFVTSPELILSAISSTVNLTTHMNLDPKTQLLHYLHDKEMLFIMDIGEHLLSANSVLENILDKCPMIRLIVTSPQILNVKDEKTFALKGLRCPESESIDDPEVSNALRFFLNRVKQTNPLYSLTKLDHSGIQKICRSVKGLPLALELSAVWAPVISYHEIAQGIERNLELSRASQVKPDGQRIIRAVFEYSWNLLTREEQRSFCDLSLFIGGFESDAIITSLGISPSVLLALKSKSLISMTDSGRFFIPESLSFIGEEKRMEVEEDRGRSRHLYSQYFGDYTEQTFKLISEGKNTDFIHRIAMEIVNIQSAWIIAVQDGSLDLLDQFIPGLNHYYTELFLYQEGEKLFEIASIQLDEMEHAEIEQNNRHQVSLGQICLSRGFFNYYSAKYEKSNQLFRRSLDIFERVGNQKDKARALNGLGIVTRRMSDNAKAKHHHEESLKIYKKINHKKGIAETKHHLGRVSNFMGYNPAAKQLYEESLELYRKTDDRKQTASVLLDLGISLGKLGRHEYQNTCLRESLKIRKEIEDRMGIASSLEILGYMEYLHGEFGASQRNLQESLKIRREIGDRWGEASSQISLACVFSTIGVNQEARKLFEDSYRTFSDIGYRRGMARAQNKLGGLILLMEDPDSAAPFIDKGMTIFTQIGDKQGMTQCLLNMGFVEILKKNMDTAAKLFKDALIQAKELNHLQSILEAIAGIALTWTSEDESRKYLGFRIIIYVFHQPGLTRDSKDRIKKIMSKTNMDIPAETDQTVMKKIQNLSLETIIDKILKNEI